jgi:hypothetical protein
MRGALALLVLFAIGSAGWGLETYRRAEARRQAIKLQRDTTRARFDAELQRAATAAAGRDFSSALTEADSAEVTRDADRALFDSTELAAMDATLAATRRQIKEQMTSLGHPEPAASARTETVCRSEIIPDLITRCRGHVDAHRYTQALAACEQVLVLDPGNEYARGLRPLLEVQVNLASPTPRPRYD